ncbi:MAG: hypothetical protein JWO30_2654 [Fibrobacteres bacterium]|nr:hypothetical protein [Fibrobacterota bacterium]
MSVDIRAAHLAMRRSGSDVFPPECLEYLLHLVFRASFQGKGFRDLPAAELCRILRQQAAEDFGTFAEMTLDRFGLKTFDDVGRAVFLLAEHGCLTLRDGETRADYAAAGPIRFPQG